MLYFGRRLLAAALISGAASAALAQNYPSKPIHVVIPFAAGGLLDGTIRALGQQITESVGQPVVVENRPGGSTFIGMTACAKAPADGYTVCATTPDSLSYNPLLFTRVPYDPDDFAAVTNLAFTNNVIVANASAPFDSFKDMIAFARSKPGAINWGTWGTGSIPHIYLEWISHHFSVDMAQVPYKGAGQAIPALLGGEIHVTYGGLGFVLASVRAGKLKALAITGDQRSSLLPDVPAMNELGGDPGLPSYFGVFAPAKTPGPVLEKLSSEMAKALQSPRMQEFLKAQTLDPVGNSPREFGEFVRADREHARRVFQSMGIRPVDGPL